MDPAEWSAIRLSVQLAGLTTVLLLALGMPMGWWLARTRCAARPLAAAVVALPLVLPPSVLGFYLLAGLGPQGPVGRFTDMLGLGHLPFTFSGLLVASLLYSMPFVVQPLQQAFEALDERTLEAAATLRGSPLDRFFTVALPQARGGVLTAAVLGFAHTVGEFGVVLMIGGNIPDRTRTLSVLIYDHVEAAEFPEAHRLAGGMLLFSLLVLLALQALNRRRPARAEPAG